MALWRFMDYVDEGNNNLIQMWRTSQNDAVKAAFDATLLMLADTADWTSPRCTEFKVLTEDHIGLGEIRFNVHDEGKKRHFRPVGIWPRVGSDFIILLGIEKMGRMLIPRDAFNEALRYKNLYERQGRGSICEHI